jgi:hypothetical protein
MSLKDYIQSIIDYAENPCDEAREKVEGFSSGEVDRLHWHEYERLQTFFKKYSDKKFEGIKNQDPHMWGRLLLQIFSPTQELFKQLKAVSPFAGKTLVHVDYGENSSQINFEDLERKIHEKIGRQDFKIENCDDYLVALDVSDSDLQKMVDSADVTWLYCGILGQDNARRCDGSDRDEGNSTI